MIDNTKMSMIIVFIIRNYCTILIFTYFFMLMSC